MQPNEMNALKCLQFELDACTMVSVRYSPNWSVADDGCIRSYRSDVHKRWVFVELHLAWFNQNWLSLEDCSPNPSSWNEQAMLGANLNVLIRGTREPFERKPSIVDAMRSFAQEVAIAIDCAPSDPASCKWRLNRVQQSKVGEGIRHGIRDAAAAQANGSHIPRLTVIIWSVLWLIRVYVSCEE